MTGINRMEDIQEGRCQCGDISYSINKSKIISTHHCHCKDCQRTTGSGKATIIFIAKSFLLNFFLSLILAVFSWPT